MNKEVIVERPSLLELNKPTFLSHGNSNNKKSVDTDSEVRHDAAQKMGDWPPEVDLQE